MSVSLEKGQKVDLTKGNSKLKNIIVGLGWDEAETKKATFFAPKKANVDCDASVLLLTSGSKLTSKDDVVYFGNLTHKSKAIRHMGDNLTGGGDGDDEQVLVNLLDVPTNIEKLVFVVNIYDATKRNQHFGMIKNAFIRIIDADTNTELCKYNLSDSYSNMKSVIIGEVYRHQNEWKFNALGEGATEDGLTEISKRYS